MANKVIKERIGKVYRYLPKTWDKDVTVLTSTTNGLVDLSGYVMNMNRALLDIKEYYEDDFNKDNTYTIDNYIDMFNYIVRKIDKLLLNKNHALHCNDEKYKFDPNTSFCIFSKLSYIAK